MGCRSGRDSPLDVAWLQAAGVAHAECNLKPTRATCAAPRQACPAGPCPYHVPTHRRTTAAQP